MWSTLDRLEAVLEALNDEEFYRRHLESRNWNVQDTKRLVRLVGEYDMRWPVVYDRFLLCDLPKASEPGSDEVPIYSAELQRIQNNEGDWIFPPQRVTLPELKDRFFKVVAAVCKGKDELSGNVYTLYYNREMDEKRRAPKDPDGLSELTSALMTLANTSGDDPQDLNTLNVCDPLEGLLSAKPGAILASQVMNKHIDEHYFSCLTATRSSKTSGGSSGVAKNTSSLTAPFGHENLPEATDLYLHDLIGRRFPASPILAKLNGIMRHEDGKESGGIDPRMYFLSRRTLLPSVASMETLEAYAQLKLDAAMAVVLQRRKDNIVQALEKWTAELQETKRTIRNSRRVNAPPK